MFVMQARKHAQYRLYARYGNYAKDIKDALREADIRDERARLSWRQLLRLCEEGKVSRVNRPP
jgi:hypothetical protein